MSGKLFNAGQTCIAPDYVLIPEAARDRFVDACRAVVTQMYPTLATNRDYTAIVNPRHHARLTSLLDDARARGAQVVELNPAGEPLEGAGHKLAPTLVLDPTDEMAVMQEEIFGPILPVRTYRGLDEAIAYVNDHPRPLALYFSNDEGAVAKVIDETISGGVTVNDTMLHIAQDDLPFGGVGPSGIGHYHGFEGFENFSKKKPVFHQARINSTGLLRPPFGRIVEGFLKLVLRG
jgi:acyl-CoA reductase-like NAD-dependent aldehyde dehydrogenase